MKTTRALPGGLAIALITFAVFINGPVCAQKTTSSGSDTKFSSNPDGQQSSARALTVQFQTTVYQLQTASDQLPTLDGQVLARQAETAESLLKALAEKGPAKILYRIDQPANVFSEKIIVSTKEPVVTGSRKTATGQTINRIAYENVGVVASLSVTNPPPPGSSSERLIVKLGIEVAALVKDKEDEQIPNHPRVRSVTLDHGEPLELGRPRTIVVVSSASKQEEVAPVAYIIRYLFKPLESK